MIRVLLADDQKLVRDGWLVLLDHAPGIQVIGQARDGQEAVELARELWPDVILMDVDMPRLDGLTAARRIISHQRKIKVLIVTQSLDETLVETALQVGASGYICKSDAFQELLPAIRALCTHQPYFSKTVQTQCFHVVDKLRSRVSVRAHAYRDEAWAALDDQIECAKTAAQIIVARAGSVCAESRTLSDRAHDNIAASSQLLRLRHPDAPPAI